MRYVIRIHIDAFFVHRKYSVSRTTQGLKIPYYVKENFHSEYQGSLRRLEISIEEEFMNSLRQTCAREKSYSMYIELFSFVFNVFNMSLL